MAPDESSSFTDTDGPLNRTMSQPRSADQCFRYHASYCGCTEPDHCVSIYERCVIRKKMYHSLIYVRRNSTISYFVQYRCGGTNFNFGKIQFFFTSKQETFALIEDQVMEKHFSDFFSSSPYYHILRKPIDSFYFVLSSKSSALRCIPVSSIENHCLCFEFLNSNIVTPLSLCYEHD